MFSTRLLRPLAAAAFAVGLLAGSPANATDHATVVGTGTISPGLPLTGCLSNQTVTFDGTAVLVGTHAGTYSVHFDGTSSICESLQTGSGSGTLSGGVTGNVTYSRTGAAVTLSGTVSVSAVGHNIVAGGCTFEATAFNPTTGFVLECSLVIL